MPAQIVSKSKVGSGRNGLPPTRGALVIGLVNNMPDGAIKATERQFLGLLDEAAGPIPVDLRLLSLPAVPRSASAFSDLMADYGNAASLAPAMWTP